MITKENFVCDRFCGKCCMDVRVQLNSADIKRIQNAGHATSTFVEFDPFDEGKQILKQVGGRCVFLAEATDGSFSCSIYEDRPQICRDYPFFDHVQVPMKSCHPDQLILLENIKK